MQLYAAIRAIVTRIYAPGITKKRMKDGYKKEGELAIAQVFAQDEALQALEAELQKLKSMPDENYDEYTDNQVKRLQAAIFARKRALEAYASGLDSIDGFNPYVGTYEE